MINILVGGEDTRQGCELIGVFGNRAVVFKNCFYGNSIKMGYF
jgi:hypothetical protein